MNTKKMIAAISIAFFSLSVLLTPTAMANNYWNNNWNDHNNGKKLDYRDTQKLKACLRVLNDNRVHWNDNDWKKSNNWNDRSNFKQNLKFCINLVNDKHDWKDHNNKWDNWDKWSNQHSDKRDWDNKYKNW